MFLSTFLINKIIKYDHYFYLSQIIWKYQLLLCPVRILRWIDSFPLYFQNHRRIPWRKDSAQFCKWLEGRLANESEHQGLMSSGHQVCRGVMQMQLASQIVAEKRGASLGVVGNCIYTKPKSMLTQWVLEVVGGKVAY